jgi:murein DD-endopeptidase MepM/ murein hydrolase activator NlpD
MGKIIISSFVWCAVISALYVTTKIQTKPKENPVFKDVEQKPVAAVKPEILKKHPHRYVLKEGDNIFSAMIGLSFSRVDSNVIVNLLRKYVNFRKVKPGFVVEYLKEENSNYPNFLKFFHKIDSYVLIVREKDRWAATEIKLKVEKKIKVFKGQVASSFWDSGIKAGVDSSVVYSMVDVFEYQFDFSRQVRKLDQWLIVVEENLVDNKHLRWGDILAAQYRNQGELYEAFRFKKDNLKVGYFDRKGNNVEGLFLRSPIRYQRISSRFKLKRFHPILKINRPHYGVDYAASRGTPVRSVGDGVVASASYSRGGGNTVVLRHNKKYKTVYRHLSKFARRVRKNRKISQGEVIGYVGSTGLATGPHLHFEFHHRGKYIDPLGKKFPRKNSLNKKEVLSLNVKANQLIADLRLSFFKSESEDKKRL